MTYSNWKDGEPNHLAGCGHMTTTGLWTMTPCEEKLDAAICQISGMCVQPLTHKRITAVTERYLLICLNFSADQMSPCCTSGPTLASAPTLWERGHGCLSETTAMPSTSRVLNCSRMHACPAKKVGSGVRRALTSPPRRLLALGCAAHDTELKAS